MNHIDVRQLAFFFISFPHSSRQSLARDPVAHSLRTYERQAKALLKITAHSGE
jgi:hypothetical protein